MTVSTQTDTATALVDPPICTPTNAAPPVQADFHPSGPISNFWPQPTPAIQCVNNTTPSVNPPKTYNDRPALIRSVSQTSLEANCYSPHAIEGIN